MSGLKDVSLKDVSLKDVSLKDVVVPLHLGSIGVNREHSPLGKDHCMAGQKH